MVDASENKLQALAQRNFDRDLNGALRVASGLSLDANGVARSLTGRDFNASFEELVTLLGGRAVSLPGTTGSYVQTPDHASLDITGDIDIRAEIIDVTGSGNRALLSKWGPAAQNSYEWRESGFGQNQLVWSTDGTAALTDDLAPLGEPVAFRVTMAVASGTITSLKSSDGTLDGTWVQVDQDVVGATSIFASTTPLRVGARSNAAGDNAITGQLRRLQLRNGIDGTIVADPDFRFLAPGTTSFTDSTGKLWTFVGDAVIV